MTNLITVKGRPGRVSAGGIDPIEARLAAASLEVRDNFGRADYRAALAELMTRIIYEGFESENVLDLFADVQTRVDKNDDILIEQVEGLRAYWVAEGAQVDSSSLDEHIWRLPRDLLAFSLDEFVEKFRSGFAHEAANVIRLAIQQMDGEVHRRIFALFTAIIGDSSDYYEEGNGVSLTWLRENLTAVKDVSRSRKIVIAGRATMTDQVMNLLEDANGFTPETNEDIVQRGVLARYRGATILEFKNYSDGRGGPRIPANELAIVGADSTVVGFWGGLEALEEVNRRYWHYEAERLVGMAIRKPAHLRRYVDTSIDEDTGEAISA